MKELIFHYYYDEGDSMKKDWRDPPNLTRLFATLAYYHVCYVLFGTVGLIAYGAVLPTGDLDICPAPDKDNLRRLATLLSSIEAKPHIAPSTSNQKSLWQPEPLVIETFDHLFQTVLGELDIVPYPYGPNGKTDRFTYERLKECCATKRAFDIHIPVGAFEDIVASKLSARREKDLHILPEIARLQHERAQGKETGWPLVEESSSE
jgi:hypothetical protein